MNSGGGVRIAGIDGAFAKPTAVSLFARGGHLISCEKRAYWDPPDGITHAVIERPYIERLARPQVVVDLMQAAATCYGILLARGAEVQWATAKEWRTTLGRGWGSKRKAVVINLLRRDYSLPSDWDDDLIDAFGIGVYACTLWLDG